MRSFHGCEESEKWNRSIPALAPVSSGIAGLQALGRERSMLDRRLGEGLRLFRDRRFDTMEIGHQSFGDLAFNELGLHPSRAYELASFAEGLERWPALARAFHSGRLGRSKIELLLQVVEPDMVDGWIGLAVTMPAPVLKKVVRGYLKKVRGIRPEERADDYERVDIACPDWVWNYFRTEGRELVEAVSGRVIALWEVLELHCAEFLSEFPGASPEEPLDEDDPVDLPTEEELRRTSGIEPGEEEEGGSENPDPSCGLPDPALARDAWHLIEILKALMARRQSLDWRIGSDLDRMSRARVPVNVESALGRSPRWARGLISLNRSLKDLPATRSAFQEGRIGCSKAKLVADIAEPETEKAWVARARKTAHRTLKRDVDAMVGLRNLDPVKWRKRTKGRPPDKALRKDLKMKKGDPRPVALENLKAVADIRNPRDRWKRPSGGGKSAPNGLWAPPSAARVIRRGIQSVKDLLGTEDEGVAIAFLVEYFRQQHGKDAGKSRPCAVAGCSRKGVHKHHLVYRSRGGSDDETNLIWLCLAHHLAGEHGGRLKIQGKAPDDIYVLVGNRIWKNDEILADLEEIFAGPQ